MFQKVCSLSWKHCTSPVSLVPGLNPSLSSCYDIQGLPCDGIDAKFLKIVLMFYLICVPNLVVITAIFFRHLKGENQNWRRIGVWPGKIVPQVAKVLEGESVILHCGSLNRVSWSSAHNRDGSLDDRHVMLSPSSVKLNNLVKNDTTYYYCWRNVGNSRSFLDSSLVIISNIVQYGHVIPNRVEVPEDSSVTLYCGSSKPVQWISSSPKVKLVKGIDNKLYIERFKERR